MSFYITGKLYSDSTSNLYFILKRVPCNNEMHYCSQCNGRLVFLGGSYSMCGYYCPDFETPNKLIPILSEVKEIL